jgi:ornithine cyclodeaminase
MTVVGIGLLADVATGYPVLISEMTLLTALRTAATSALAAKYLAKRKASTFAIIGTGAQSEFQVLAHQTLFNLKRVQYYDTDVKAMDKFEKNLSNCSFELVRCDSAEAAIKNADIVTTATAAKHQTQILQQEWIMPGMMINAIGGDAPGKTELDPKILSQAKIVVDYIEQAKDEGEIQNYQAGKVYAELWELIANRKKGRMQDDEVFLFDSVGIALEDYTILKLIYSLAEDFHIGHVLDILPEIKNSKNLFGELS